MRGYTTKIWANNQFQSDNLSPSDIISRNGSIVKCHPVKINGDDFQIISANKNIGNWSFAAKMGHLRYLGSSAISVITHSGSIQFYGRTFELSNPAAGFQPL